MANGPTPPRQLLDETLIDQPINMSTKKPIIIRPPIENSHLREILESRAKPLEPLKPMPVLPKASRFPVGPESFPTIRETHSVPVYQSSSSGSSQYPSSPGSSHSSSTNGSLDSPPRTQTPPSMVPVFALHPSGLYYVASLVHFHSLEIQSADDYSSVCHPVTIPVQFCANRIPTGNSQLQRPKISPELPVPTSASGTPQQHWAPTPGSVFYPSPPLMNRASVLAAALEKPIHE